MRRIRVLGHPLHPPLTHFPLGLLGTVPVWDALALMGGDPASAPGGSPVAGSVPIWWTVGYWTLAAGLVLAVPAAVTGLLDYASLPTESPGEGTARNHLFLALGAVSLAAASFVVRMQADGVEPDHVAWAVGLALAGAVGLGVAGWLGAELTFGHGIGVRRSQPEAPGSPGQGEGTGTR